MLQLPMSVFVIKRNDTLPYLDAVLSDDSGVLDLTNATSVTLLTSSTRWKKPVEQPSSRLLVEGYGGNVSRDDGEVFDPTQIKSTIGNTGAYDPTNSDVPIRRNNTRNAVDRDDDRPDGALNGRDGSGLVGSRGRGADDAARTAEGGPARSVASKVQLKGKRLEHSVEEDTLQLIHYSSNGALKAVDPDFLGKGVATSKDRRKDPRSFDWPATCYFIPK